MASVSFSELVPSQRPATTAEGSAMNSAAPPKIETRGLNFYYGPVQALFGISLSVPARCVTALIGPSGCGKTTLLRLLLGELSPAAGKVEQGTRLEIVRHGTKLDHFKILPRRWVVERTFSWFGRNRRLNKDYENLADTLLAFVTLAAIQLGVRRLARA